jgi:hypothetical protein
LLYFQVFYFTKITEILLINQDMVLVLTLNLNNFYDIKFQVELSGFQ